MTTHLSSKRFYNFNLCPCFSLYLSVRWWEPYINSSCYLLGVDDKLSICLSVRKAVRTPYQLVSLSVVRLWELLNLLCSCEVVRTPYQFISIREAMRTPYKPVCLHVRWWELLINLSLSARPWELPINLSVCMWGSENSLSVCLCTCKTLRTPCQLISLAVRWQELHINLSIYKAVRTPYQVVYLWSDENFLRIVSLWRGKSSLSTLTQDRSLQCKRRRQET